MGLRLIKRHFTFLCTRFLFIKGIHSISKGVLFSFIDNSLNVLKVAHLGGGEAVAVSLLPAWVYFLPPQVAPLTLRTHNLTNFMFSWFFLFWKTNFVFKRLHFSAWRQACHCNWQTQNSMECAFEMNQLIKLKNLCKIFEFCLISTPPPPQSFFFSHLQNLCMSLFLLDGALCNGDSLHW